MTKHIRTLTIVFDAKIHQNEIPLFRGAVLKGLGDKANLLYHNHTGTYTFRYSYPLIQYKHIHNKAVVLGVEKGTEIIGQLLNTSNFSLQIGNEKKDMKIEAVNLYDNEITLTKDITFRYRLRNWLPLNSRNYAQFRNSESLVEQIMMMEDVLTGNILSFLKGIDIHLEKQEEQIRLHITDITNQRSITYKHVRLMAFDIEFKTNISLPQYIGLGKSASVGCGVLTKITN